MKKSHLIVRLSFTLSLLLMALLLAGCIRSRLSISSNPPEAKVTFQKVERGKTPIDIPFIWYGAYYVRVEKEGYAPIDKVEYLQEPPWFILPMDFLFEVLPFPVYDTHKRHYDLQPESPSAQDAPTSATFQMPKLP
jgi:hypothetical protein